MAYLPDYDAALEHLLTRSTDQELDMMVTGYQNLKQSAPEQIHKPLMGIGSVYLPRSLACWIQTGDIQLVKQLAYMSAKARRMAYQTTPQTDVYGFFRVFSALLSDHKDLIHWFAWHILPVICGSPGHKPAFKRPNSEKFQTFQCHLAMMGEMDWLAERSEQALQPDVKLKAKTHAIDHRFFIALAKGDTVAMESELMQLLKGRAARPRNTENGLTYQSKVVSGWGFMLAKIAYLNGYELDIDSPWLPQSWLPVQPLPEYQEEVDAIADFDLFSPFAKGSPYCRNAIDFSPIAPDQPQPNIREWVETIVHKRVTDD